MADSDQSNQSSEFESHAITPTSRRALILISTLIETVIFSGIIFGWPALFYMLKNERIYAHLCLEIGNFSGNFSMEDYDNEDDNVITKQEACVAQENILNMAFTIGIFSMGFTSFAWGFLLESNGLRFVRLALNLLISIGCLLLAMTTSEISAQIIPAVIILALIGVPLRIANMQIADFFPKKRSTIITLYSGAFSASPVVFVLIKHAYDHWSLTYFWANFILFAISVTLLPINTLMLPRISVRLRENNLRKRFNEYRTKIDQLDRLNRQFDLELRQNNSKKPKFITKKSLKLLNNELDNTTSDLLINDDRKSTKPIIVNFTEYQQKRKEPGFFKRIFSSKKNQMNDDGTIDPDSMTFKVSLYSISFLMHNLWFSWINTYMVLYSGSMALWLDRVTNDPGLKSNFTQTFGLVQISALIIAPLSGAVMDALVRRAGSEPDPDRRKIIQSRSGFWPMLFTTMVLAGAVWCRFIDSSLAVYISIAFITLLRALFIAVASAYLRVRYPAEHFNRLNGIMCTVGAFFSLLQFPLFYFESKSITGAFWVNVFCAIMTAISLLHPLSLAVKKIQKNLLKMERKHRERILQRKLQQQPPVDEEDDPNGTIN